MPGGFDLGAYPQLLTKGDRNLCHPFILSCSDIYCNYYEIYI